MTFAIEKVDDSGAIWLCANDLRASEKIAEFVSVEAAIVFTQILDLMIMQGHAKGQLGI